MTKDARFTLLVVQPDDECPPERFGPWLEEAGARLELVRPFAGEAVPNQVDADGLLVLGGDMGANDDDNHPWLADVRALVRRAVEDDVPTLGICLGGQILASATGGTVARGAAGMESGVIEVTALSEAESDDLLGQLSWPILQGSMHRDAIIDLPPDAVLLASSEDYPHQAFRFGRSAWGVQFHPELSPERYRQWAAYVREDEHTTALIHTGIAQFDELDDRVRPAAHALANAFARVVLESTSRVEEAALQHSE